MIGLFSLALLSVTCTGAENEAFTQQVSAVLTGNLVYQRPLKALSVSLDLERRYSACFQSFDESSVEALYYGRGIAYLSLKRYGEALGEADRIIGMYPQNPQGEQLKKEVLRQRSLATRRAWLTGGVIGGTLLTTGIVLTGVLVGISNRPPGFPAPRPVQLMLTLPF